MSFRLQIECAHDERAIEPRGNHENEWGDQRPAESDRAVAERPPRKAEIPAASRHAAARRYMLAGAGRQVRFGPVLDGRRHAGDHGRLVDRHCDLLRLS